MIVVMVIVTVGWGRGWGSVEGPGAHFPTITRNKSPRTRDLSQEGIVGLFTVPERKGSLTWGQVEVLLVVSEVSLPSFNFWFGPNYTSTLRAMSSVFSLKRRLTGRRRSWSRRGAHRPCRIVLSISGWLPIFAGSCWSDWRDSPSTPATRHHHPPLHVGEARCGDGGRPSLSSHNTLIVRRLLFQCHPYPRSARRFFF
jgi:hypothetical protein